MQASVSSRVLQMHRQRDGIFQRVGHEAPALGNGDKLADDDPVWTFVVDAIAEACATLFLTLASERIVLGGGVTNSRPFLADAVAKRCAELLDRYLPYIGETAPVEIAALGQNAGPRGSL